MDDVGAEIASRVKILFADSLAAAFAGWSSPQSMQMSTAVREVFGDGDSTVVGAGSASLGGAALINGYLTTARSVCDVHQPTLCHVTPVVVPAVLAFAERDGVDGATLLAAMTAGLEATVRVGLGLDYPVFRARGWHTPGVAGPIGGALGVSRVLGLDPETAERAMGIAGSQAGGTFASFGTPTIKFHQARAAFSAVIAGSLAAHSFQGPTSILTQADGGVFNTFSDGGRPSAVAEGLGERWELLDITTRLWPAAAALQSILTIVEECDVPPIGQIETIDVGLSPESYGMNADMGWETMFDATLSARFVTSLAIHGASLWDLSEQSLRDPDITRFAGERVGVFEDPALPEGGATLRVTTGNDEVAWTREHPKGSPAHPATWADTEAKMHVTGDGLIGGRAVDSLLAMIDDLESVADVRSLTNLIAETS
jgi:2-methylcitrate dehydratase PrpD